MNYENSNFLKQLILTKYLFGSNFIFLNPRQNKFVKDYAILISFSKTLKKTVKVFNSFFIFNNHKQEILIIFLSPNQNEIA